MDSESRRRQAVTMLREVVGMVSPSDTVTVVPAPANGCCLWYCLGRCVGQTKNGLVDGFDRYLQGRPELWSAVSAVHSVSTPEEYIEALRQGRIWGDESVLFFVWDVYGLQSLILGLKDSQGSSALVCNPFPYGTVGDQCAILRLVDGHYDNIQLNRSYVIQATGIVRLLWWGSSGSPVDNRASAAADCSVTSAARAAPRRSKRPV